MRRTVVFDHSKDRLHEALGFKSKEEMNQVLADAAKREDINDDMFLLSLATQMFIKMNEFNMMPVVGPIFAVITAGTKPSQVIEFLYRKLKVLSEEELKVVVASWNSSLIVEDIAKAVAESALKELETESDRPTKE